MRDCKASCNVMGLVELLAIVIDKSSSLVIFMLLGPMVIWKRVGFSCAMSVVMMCPTLLGLLLWLTK